MSNPAQLLLLADHIKLSLLEWQRAKALDVEPNSQEAEISRSLESLRLGIEAAERKNKERQDDEDIDEEYAWPISEYDRQEVLILPQISNRTDRANHRSKTTISRSRIPIHRLFNFSATRPFIIINNNIHSRDSRR